LLTGIRGFGEGQAISKGYFMSRKSVSDEAKAVVRRNTEEVQGKGRFEVFEELFADDFVDHTTQPGTTPDKAGVRKLYTHHNSRQRADLDFLATELRHPETFNEVCSSISRASRSLTFALCSLSPHWYHSSREVFHTPDI